MITVKGFKIDDQGRLYCQPGGISSPKFYYDVGQTYTLEQTPVLGLSGFHASANCDIGEVIPYYPPRENVAYCLVDLVVTEAIDDLAVGNRITILKQLSFRECLRYDKTGKWAHEYLRNIKNADVKYLQQFIIRKDKTGKYSFLSAFYTTRGSRVKWESAVIRKDKTGEYIFNFAYIPGANIERLQRAVIRKDKTGKYSYLFARYVQGANIEKLQKSVVRHDPTGEWCYKFARYIPDADIKALQRAVIRKDMEGWWSYCFALDVAGADIQTLQEAVILKDRTGKHCQSFAEDVKGADTEKLLAIADEMRKLVETGELMKLRYE